MDACNQPDDLDPAEVESAAQTRESGLQSGVEITGDSATVPPWKTLLLKFVVAEFAMVPAALFLIWVFNLPDASSVGRQLFGVRHWSWGLSTGLIATVPLLASIVMTERIRWKPFQDLHELVMTKLAPLFRGMPWWGLLLIATGAGFGEEWLFRGFGISMVSAILPSAWSPDAVQWTAIGLTALVFGGLHAMTRMYFILTLGMGFYLGLLVVETGSLMPAVVCHGLYDFLALLYIMRLDRVRQGSSVSSEVEEVTTKNTPTDTASVGVLDQ